jgi:hypothetical protein
VVTVPLRIGWRGSLQRSPETFAQHAGHVGVKWHTDAPATIMRPVSKARRRRHAAAVRLIVFAILAVSLLLRPMLSSIAEIHELAHDPGGQHLDIEAWSGNPDLQEAGNLHDGAGDTLHTLLHFAHCCGHVTATCPVFDLAPAELTVASAPSNKAREAVPRARWQSPFRPPISA